jgi:hypothetical protein
MPLFINNNAKTPDRVYFFYLTNLYSSGLVFFTNVQGDMGDRIEPQYV